MGCGSSSIKVDTLDKPELPMHVATKVEPVHDGAYMLEASEPDEVVTNPDTPVSDNGARSPAKPMTGSPFENEVRSVPEPVKAGVPEAVSDGRKSKDEEGGARSDEPGIAPVTRGADAIEPATMSEPGIAPVTRGGDAIQPAAISEPGIMPVTQVAEAIKPAAMSEPGIAPVTRGGDAIQPATMLDVPADDVVETEAKVAHEVDVIETRAPDLEDKSEHVTVTISDSDDAVADDNAVNVAMKVAVAEPKPAA